MRVGRFLPAAALVAAALLPAQSLPAFGAVAGLVRVDQVGYVVGQPKTAYLMSTTAAAGARFAVVDSTGRTALSGTVGASRGKWNNTYTAVYPVDLSAVDTPGMYQVKVSGTATGTSPSFPIATEPDLLAPAAEALVRFFQVQRDGANVIAGPLHRKASHLADRQASVYETPTFTDGGDTLSGTLKKIGGPIDVEGGWFDAGDYLKFTHTTAYALASLLTTQLRLGGGSAALRAETEFGLSWLDKMWDSRTGVLYIQVGIGSGNSKIASDHDVWRLPEADDARNVRPGDFEYFVRFRPVFRAGAPGAAISPNLAGRVGAAFALAARVYATSDPARARGYLDKAAALFGRAKTTNVGELVTALPHEFYPEDVWADDLELGGAELARAGRALGDSRASGWLAASAHWAKQYIAAPGGDTLNLYDVSALAHTSLAAAMSEAGATGLEVSRADLGADLKRQLDLAAGRSSADPFRAGAVYDDFDAVSHSFGLLATARMYREVTGQATYTALGAAQRDWVFGANAWGVSLVVGLGTTFPKCMQHQVANLSGSLTGGSPVVVGAAVNGPNGTGNFAGLGTPDGARACPAGGGDPYQAFTGHGARFLDNVSSWPSVEPAIDFVASGLLGLAVREGC